MRVNDTNAMPQSDVLNDQIPQKRGLAGPRFSDDINVMPLVFFRYAKGLGISPAVAVSDGNEIRSQNQPPLHSPRAND